MRPGLDVLLVEDNPGDARLVLEALRDSSAKVATVRDGDDAISYLRRKGSYAGVRRPDLVLLDWNLPRRSGGEVLTELKHDPDLKRIPVVVLTSSGAEEDIARAYELQANCYVTKPLGLHEFFHAVRSIQEFWSIVSRCPSD